MNGYDILSEQILKLLKEVRRLNIIGTYLVYFKQKYKWQKDFTSEVVIVEIDENNIFTYEYDFWEGQQEVTLTGITPADEVHAIPFYKVN